MRISICGGTSDRSVSDRVAEESRLLGELLARRGVHVICSGSKSGVIGHLIDGIEAGRGSITALVLKASGEEQNIHPYAASVTLVSTISERKMAMMTQSEVIIALPGGLGTHDELLSILTESKSANTSFKVILIDIDGFFAPFTRLLEHLVQTGFLRQRHLSNLLRSEDGQGALNLLPV